MVESIEIIDRTYVRVYNIDKPFTTENSEKEARYAKR